MSKEADLNAVTSPLSAAHRTAASREVATEPVAAPAPRPTPVRPAATRSDAAATGNVKQLRQKAAPASPEGEGWRLFVAPQAERGEAGRNRLNVPVPESVFQRLHQINYLLGQEHSRWQINRTMLVEHAIDVLAKNPDKWQTVLRQQRATAEGRTRNLSVRIDDEHEERVSMLRFTPDGERQVGPLLGVIVADTLGTATSAH